MTGQGHNLTGVALIPVVYYNVYSMFQNHIISIVASLCLLSGATAPDWLEIRKKTGGTVITHRTITHWLPLWGILLFVSYYLANMDSITLFGFTIQNNIIINYISAGLFGFSVGGLLHLVVDFPNPMGIPVFTPFNRLSLGLWKSGKNEAFIISVVFMFSFLYVGLALDIIEINYEHLQSLLRELKRK